MRVLNVVPTMNPFIGGGVADRVSQLCEALDRRGVKSSILTTSAGWDESIRQRLPFVDFKVAPALSDRFFLAVGLRSWLKHELPRHDVVHFHSHWAYLHYLVFKALRGKGIPHVSSAEGTLPIVGRSIQLKRIYNRLVGTELIQSAAACVALTPIEVGYYEKMGVPREKIHLIPNSVDPAKFDLSGPNLFREKCGVRGGRIILFLGRLNWIKAPEVLLEAFARIQGRFEDWNLVFVGPDEDRGAMLTELIRRHKLEGRVVLAGKVEPAVKTMAYHACDLVVVPSKQDNMPAVPLEAAICEKPVLITRNAGFLGIEDFDAGRLCECEVGDMAEKLEQLLSDPEGRLRMGKKGREMVLSRYTSDRLAEAHLKVFESVLRRD